MKRTWRRRNFFIEKDLQGRFILYLFFVVILGALLFTLIFTYLSSNVLTVTYKDYHLEVDKAPKALLYEIFQAHWLFIFFVGIGVSVLAVFLSHRIGGPIYRFKKSVEEITNGNLSFTVIIRKKDEGKELAEGMNRMIDTLNERIGRIASEAEEIEKNLKLFSEGKSGETATERFDKIKSHLERLKGSLSFFRLKNKERQ